MTVKLWCNFGLKMDLLMSVSKPKMYPKNYVSIQTVAVFSGLLFRVWEISWLFTAVWFNAGFVAVLVGRIVPELTHIVLLLCYTVSHFLDWMFWETIYPVPWTLSVIYQMSSRSYHFPAITVPVPIILFLSPHGKPRFMLMHFLDESD